MIVSKFTDPSTPTADWTDVAELQKKMADTCDTINGMAQDVGLARHVLEYDSDRRKRALARAMQPALAGGDSAAKAEAEARASEPYGKELNQLAKEHSNAEQTITAWEVAKLQWETARSLLAIQREGIKRL